MVRCLPGKPGPTEAGWSRLTLQGLVIEADGPAQPGDFAALNFTTGLTQSLLQNIVIGPGSTSPGGGIDLGPLSDTITIDNVLMQGIVGTGVKIGRGSEVRIKGGRICGHATASTLTGIGVHATGNNGGVHIIGTDVIGHSVGLQLDDSATAVSNREVFLSQATLDSNGRGLVVLDDSYVDIAGCWAASSAAENVYVGPGRNPLLSISGGTIFNAGHQVGDNSTSHGMTVLSGSFMLSGVVIRNNLGTGLRTGESVRDYTISGCKVYSNGVGLELNGTSFALTGTIFRGNGASTISPAALRGSVVSGNIGLQQPDATSPDSDLPSSSKTDDTALVALDDAVAKSPAAGTVDIHWQTTQTTRAIPTVHNPNSYAFQRLNPKTNATNPMHDTIYSRLKELGADHIRYMVRRTLSFEKLEAVRAPSACWGHSKLRTRTASTICGPPRNRLRQTHAPKRPAGTCE